MSVLRCLIVDGHRYDVELGRRSLHVIDRQGAVVAGLDVDPDTESATAWIQCEEPVLAPREVYDNAMADADDTVLEAARWVVAALLHA